MCLVPKLSVIFCTAVLRPGPSETPNPLVHPRLSARTQKLPMLAKAQGFLASPECSGRAHLSHGAAMALLSPLSSPHKRFWALGLSWGRGRWWRQAKAGPGLSLQQQQQPPLLAKMGSSSQLTVAHSSRQEGPLGQPCVSLFSPRSGRMQLVPSSDGFFLSPVPQWPTST